MPKLTAGWQRLKAWFVRRRRDLRLTARVTIAGLLALVVSLLLDLPQGYWAVFAAVIVTETSVGGSVRAALDWLIGTVGGAVYAALVAGLVPHETPGGLVLELAVALAPLVLLANLRASFRVAPVTAIIVLASANNPDLGPWMSAYERVLEIGVGSIIGVGVSLVVLPSRAHQLVAENACRVLNHMARLLAALSEAFGRPLGPDAVQPIHLEILAALTQLEEVAYEARHERATRLTDQPDPEPVPRTLHRIRADLIMIGRAAPEPLPETIAARLKQPFVMLCTEIVRFFDNASTALKNHQPAPSLDAVFAAHDDYAAETAAIRETQLMRGQPADIAGRIFALGFAFDQLRANLKDLAGRITERARVTSK